MVLEGRAGAKLKINKGYKFRGFLGAGWLGVRQPKVVVC